MANISKIRGFIPTGGLAGASMSGNARIYAVPTSNTTQSFAVGDAVMLATSASTVGGDANGIQYVMPWDGVATTTSLPVGLIVGIQTADPLPSLVGTSLSLEQTYINPGTRSSVRYVYVDDNPLCIFEGQIDTVAAATIGQNCAATVAATTVHTPSAPFSATYLSGVASTATLPIHILGLVQRPDNALGAYAKVLCKWNYHAYGPIATASGSIANLLTP